MSERDTVTDRLSKIERRIRQNITKTQEGDLIKPSSFIETNAIEGLEEEAKISAEMRNSAIQQHPTDDLIQEISQTKTRKTMQVQQNDLSYEIDKFEHNNRRMVPKLVKVTFLTVEGWRVIFSDPIPVFHILTKTFTNTEWKIQRTYKDFEILRQHLLE